MILSKEEEQKYIEMVRRYAYSLENIETQTELICLEAVKQCGWALQCVKEQTEAICLEAVRQSGMALQFVKEQTINICLEAVKQDGLALAYVEKQTYEICLEAIKKNGHALEYVKNQTPEICWEVVTRNGCALQYVKNQTPDLCVEALKQYHWIPDYITPKFRLELMKERSDLAIKFQDGDDEFYLTAIRLVPNIFKRIDRYLSPSILDEVEMIYNCCLTEMNPKSYRQIRSLLANKEIQLDQSPYHVLEQLHAY